MSVPEQIVRFIEEQGGSFQAPEGNAGKQLAEALKLDYNNVSTTLTRLVTRGVLERRGEARRVYEYKLLRSSSQFTRPDTIPYDAVPRIPKPSFQLGTNGDTSYDELAAALLRRVVMIESRYRDSIENTHSTQQQLASVQSEIQSSKRQLSLYKDQVADLQKLVKDRDDQIAQLHNERALLKNELAEHQNRGQRIRDLVSQDTLNELDRMMRERPTLNGADDER